MTTLDPMPLIRPAEHVTVDTGHLATAVLAVHHAIRGHREPFRYHVVAAVNVLREALSSPLLIGQELATVEAEPLWWVVQAADELGDALCLSPVGTLFTAVDELCVALAEQALRTDLGMAAALEAECLVEDAVLFGEDPR